MSPTEPAISLRPVRAEDEYFLRELFAATRAEKLRAAGLDEEALRQVLLLQFRAQQPDVRLLRRLLDEADAAGRPVLAHVEKTNPARRLYARLGFEAFADDGVYLDIRRPPRCGC